MKVHGKIWGAGRGPRNATPIPSKTPLVWKPKCEKAFLSLLTTKEYTAHNFTDSNWTVNSRSQAVSLQHKPTHSLRWDQQFGDGVKMRLDVHPEFQTAAEVLSSRWIGCRCQNKGSLKNGFFSAKGKCDLPLHRVWHSWEIKKIKRMLNHFRSSYFELS